MSDTQAVEKPRCDHYWAWHCHRGMSVRLCMLCHEPNWDELVKQQTEVDRLHADLADAQRERDELAALLSEQIRMGGRRNPRPPASSGRGADTEGQQG